MFLLYLKKQTKTKTKRGFELLWNFTKRLITVDKKLIFVCLKMKPVAKLVPGIGFRKPVFRNFYSNMLFNWWVRWGPFFRFQNSNTILKNEYKQAGKLEKTFWGNYIFLPWTITLCQYSSMNCQLYCPTLSYYHFFFQNLHSVS